MPLHPPPPPLSSALGWVSSAPRLRDPKPMHSTVHKWSSFDPYKDNAGCVIRVARRPSSLVAPPRARCLLHPSGARDPLARAAATASARAAAAPPPPPPPLDPQLLQTIAEATRAYLMAHSRAPTATAAVQTGTDPPPHASLAPSTAPAAAAEAVEAVEAAAEAEEGGGELCGWEESDAPRFDAPHEARGGGGGSAYDKVKASMVAAPPSGCNVSAAAVVGSAEKAAAGWAAGLHPVHLADFPSNALCQLDELDSLLHQHQADLRARAERLRKQKQRERDEWMESVREILPTPTKSLPADESFAAAGSGHASPSRFLLPEAPPLLPSSTPPRSKPPPRSPQPLKTIAVERSSLESLAELEALLEEQHLQLVSKGFIPAEASKWISDVSTSSLCASTRSPSRHLYS